MKQTLGFDVYGTLVDPVDMGKHLEVLIGGQSRAFAQLWHDKKVEYAFRRGLMQDYENFGVCTQQALQYCMTVFQVDLSEQEQQQLLAEFANLNAFEDVIPGLIALAEAGHQLHAFSNGPESAVRQLLGNAEVLPQLQQVISVDDLQTYKPDPRVYQYLAQRSETNAENCWLVSSNPWDVIGAKAAGLKAAWVKRDPLKVFDPWEIEPDLVVTDLLELSEKLND